MKNQVGLWIDHREAFVVFADELNAVSEDIKSGMEKHVRFSMSADGKADDQRDQQFQTHLNQYYDKVIDHISTAKSILIFGPGEAKTEFKKRLEAKGLGTHIVGVDTVDKMTPHQIEAKVQQHFMKHVH
jgi:stalled ribosome rescue protein Dom34